LPDSVTIFDEAAQLRFINPSGLELFQAPDMASLVSSGYLALSPRDAARWLDGHRRVISGESVRSSYDITGMA
jgi:hypothetical protein